jgi:hypothetical protein
MDHRRNDLNLALVSHPNSPIESNNLSVEVGVFHNLGHHETKLAGVAQSFGGDHRGGQSSLDYIGGHCHQRGVKDAGAHGEDANAVHS